jgi:hypothetical protein
MIPITSSAACDGLILAVEADQVALAESCQRIARAGAHRQDAMDVHRVRRGHGTADRRPTPALIRGLERDSVAVHVSESGDDLAGHSVARLWAALDAIDDSRSAFEQYHGLRLAEMMVSDLTATQRAQLVVVTSARCAVTGSGGIATDAQHASGCWRR